LKKYPNFLKAKKHVGVLLPGDILFIPSLWFHNTLTLSPSISINQFFKSLTLDHNLYQKKDLYGNKDLIPAEKSIEMVMKACQNLSSLPPDYYDFYLKKLLDVVESHIKKED
jgi:tRNA wybutosine-synthesizing protein 5